MKGMALETLAYLVLAVISILLIIVLVSGKLGPAARSAYCSFLRGLKSILPLPPHLKTTLPAYCTSGHDGGVETHEITSTDTSGISRDISAFVLACWETTGKVNTGKEVLCYELVIRNIQGSVVENDVLDVLTQNGYSDFPLVWNADAISSTKSISVRYDPDLKSIVIQ